MVGLRERASALAAHVSFLAQWLGYYVVKLLSPLWGRDDRLWAFGARGGEAFADNAKYLYLHVAAERPEIRPVWLSKDPDVVAELQAAGYEAYRCRSLRGIRLQLRAGVVALTQGHRDLSMPACGGALTVMLWHGIPLKHISWDADFAAEPAPVRAARADMIGEFDLLTLPGPGAAAPFASGLRIDREKMVATGYPRNDALFAPVEGERLGADAAALDRVRALAADHPVVCYLPTYRADDPDAVGDHLDFRALDAALAERDAYLVVKPHPKEQLDLPEGLSRVIRLPEATDVYPLLRETDALVTDYSSVYFDYLLVDRPVAFYPFDLDRYRAERGFYFDYEDVTPGPVARDFPALLDAVDEVLDAAADPTDDAYADRRRQVRERVFGDPGATADPGSAAAVYELVAERSADEGAR